MDATDSAVKKMQRVTVDAISHERTMHGDHAANIYLGGLLAGLAQYVTDVYGARAAYSLIQGYADDIATKIIERK